MLLRRFLMLYIEKHVIIKQQKRNYENKCRLQNSKGYLLMLSNSYKPIKVNCTHNCNNQNNKSPSLQLLYTCTDTD